MCKIGIDKVFQSAELRPFGVTSSAHSPVTKQWGHCNLPDEWNMNAAIPLVRKSTWVCRGAPKMGHFQEAMANFRFVQNVSSWMCWNMICHTILPFMAKHEPIHLPNKGLSKDNHSSQADVGCLPPFSEDKLWQTDKPMDFAFSIIQNSAPQGPTPHLWRPENLQTRPPDLGQVGFFWFCRGSKTWWPISYDTNKWGFPHMGVSQMDVL